MGATKPSKPDRAADAINADPGELTRVERTPEEIKKYERQKLKGKPFEPDEEKTGWIEVVMVDEADQPLQGEAVAIKLPDGTTRYGSLDNNGMIRVEGFDPGTCEICFPDLDKDAWEPR